MRNIYILGGCGRIGKSTSAIVFKKAKLITSGEQVEILDTDDVVHGVKEFKYMSPPNLKNQNTELLQGWVIEYLLHPQNNIHQNIIIAGPSSHLTLNDINSISTKINIKKPVIVGYNDPGYFETFYNNLLAIDDWQLYRDWGLKIKKTKEEVKNDFLGYVKQSNDYKNCAKKLDYKYLDITDIKEFPKSDFNNRIETILKTLMNL